MSAAKAVRSEAADQQKKIAAGVIFALIAATVLYFELSDPNLRSPVTAVPAVTQPGNAPAITASAPRSAAPAAPGGPVRTVGNAAAALDPTLHMEAMLVTESVLYTGGGRNIFNGAAAAPMQTAALLRPIAPARSQTIVQPAVSGPIGPPPLPPIDLKFFGIATSANGRRQAFLLHGDDVFLAANGDIVQRKYKVISVGPNSIQMEDLTNNNRQTLPLLVRP